MCLSGSWLPSECILTSNVSLVWMLQDAAPASGHASERRAIPEERRRGPDDRRRAPHDDVSVRRRVTVDAGPLADAGSADAAPQVQTIVVRALSPNAFTLLQVLIQYCTVSQCWAKFLASEQKQHLLVLKLATCASFTSYLSPLHVCEPASSTLAHGFMPSCR